MRQGMYLATIMIKNRDCLVMSPVEEDAVVMIILEFVDHGEQPIDQDRPKEEKGGFIKCACDMECFLWRHSCTHSDEAYAV